MTMLPREIVRAGALAAVCFCLAIITYYAWCGADTACRVQSDARSHALALAREIEQLRRGQSSGAVPATQPTDMGSLFEQAVKRIGLAPANVTRVTPEPPRLLEKAALRQFGCQVDIRNIGFGQSLNLVSQIADTGSGIGVDEIRLTAAARDASADAWSIELRLSQLVALGSSTRIPSSSISAKGGNP